MPCKRFRPSIVNGLRTVVCAWCGFHKGSH